MKVTQDESEAETGKRAEHIWNEAIVFDIVDPSKMVKIKLLDSAGNVILKHSLNLKYDNRLIDYAVQGEEIWAYASYKDENENTFPYQRAIDDYQEQIRQIDERPHQYGGDLQIPDGDEAGPKLRLRCKYNYNDKEELLSRKNEWDLYIE